MCCPIEPRDGEVGRRCADHPPRRVGHIAPCLGGFCVVQIIVQVGDVGSYGIAVPSTFSSPASPAIASRCMDSLRTRWTNIRYFYRKLRAGTRPVDRLWYWWWMLGETLQWLRLGYGVPRGE